MYSNPANNSGRIIERRPSESVDSDSLGNNVLFIELDGFTRYFIQIGHRCDKC